MKSIRLLIGGGLLMLNACAQSPVAKDDFSKDLSLWAVEQMPGGRVVVADGALNIEDKAGATVWWKQRLSIPLTITYEATLISAGGPLDRVSDLNCFWMASEPDHPTNLFFEGHGRTGKFETYDRLQTYYVGQGGNENTTTRFRRYQGHGVKPLLPEYDRQEKSALLEANRPYRIKITADEAGIVRYYRDDVLVFEFKDPSPLREGWFGIRTVWSHLRIRDFKITQP